MAPLVVLGAALASDGVERTVAERITVSPLPTAAEIVVLAVALFLTAAYNRLRLPTSTIQILVFSLVGTAIGEADGCIGGPSCSSWWFGRWLRSWPARSVKEVRIIQ
jgi:phosphate/sulfate permease